MPRIVTAHRLLNFRRPATKCSEPPLKTQGALAPKTLFADASINFSLRELARTMMSLKAVMVK
jgi:hypothetical protein